MVRTKAKITSKWQLTLPLAVRKALNVGAGDVVAFVSPVVFAELFAHPGWQPKDVTEFLGATAVAVDWDLTEGLWTREESARGSPRRLLAYFVIGSHATEIAH